MNARGQGSLHPLLEPRAAELLAGYGIDYVSHELVRSADEAVTAARRLGWPVVLKVVSPDIVHKSDVGGVVLGLNDEDAVSTHFAGLLAHVAARAPGALVEGVLVCSQVTGPLAELIVGGISDPTFGPAVMIGSGGVFAEVLGDVSFRLAPLHEADGMDMLKELRAYKTLTGFRDIPPLDTVAVARIARALGDLLVDHPEIVEVDLNPVLVVTEGCTVVDARLMTSV